MAVPGSFLIVKGQILVAISKLPEGQNSIPEPNKIKERCPCSLSAIKIYEDLISLKWKKVTSTPSPIISFFFPINFFKLLQQFIDQIIILANNLKFS